MAARRSSRRSAPAAAAAPVVSAFSSDPIGAGVAARAGFLGQDDLDRLMTQVYALLSDYGVVIIHPKARAALLAAGAVEGAEANRLRLPKHLVKSALSSTPKSLTLFGKNKNLDVHIPRKDGAFIMRTGTGAHGFVDTATGNYRNTDLRAVRDIAAVASHLDQVGFIAHPFVHGVPEVAADLHSFATMVQHTDKHCWIQPYGKDNIEYLLKIAAVAAGGEGALRERPIASLITCSFTPLEFKYMDTEVILQAAKYQIPLHACALPTAGGSGPLGVAGSVIVAAAEILSMLCVAHVLAPGTPVIATPLMFALDMRTGSAMASAPQSVQAASMAVQLMKQGFGLPTHSYGMGSDTPDVDHQSMAERMMLGQSVALAGADILGGVGQLETATVFSPVQAVLDNEMGQILRHYTAAPVLDDAALDLSEIMKTPAGGHFLDRPETIRDCRSQFQPQVFQRQGRDDYEKSNRHGAFEAARDHALALISAAPEEGVLSAEARAEINQIVTAGTDFIVAENNRPGKVSVI